MTTAGVAVELGELVGKRFDLGRPSGPLTSAGRGGTGEVFRLDTERGWWAVKALFAGTTDNSEEDVRLQLAAAISGARLPRPIHTEAGRAVIEVGKQRIRVYDWVDIADEPKAPA